VFVDFLEEERKLSAYVDAEVLVYPSLHEVFGLVPFEAAMCGTPVLVTESSGCAGVFKKIGVDNLVRYGDVVGLERKIVNVLSHLDPKREDVQKIRKYVVDNLNWSVIVEKMVNVYREVVEKR
ncbi:glycosyltransferase, partial [Candidatus Hakubella thermalkaliphila]